MKCIFVLLLLASLVASQLGGVEELIPANAEVQGFVNKIKPSLETKANKKFSLFKAIEYRSQVVAGTNYFVKVQVGENEYAHVRIYVHFSGNPVQMDAFRLNKAKSDELDYFEGEEEVPLVVKKSFKLGGASDIVPATKEVQAIAESVYADFQKKLGSDTAMFKVIHYQDQIVAGKNYFIKVQLDTNDYAFLRVHKPLTGNNVLSAYQLGKKANENIEYFEKTVHKVIPDGFENKLIPSTAEVQYLVNNVREEFETSNGKQQQFRALNYKTQQLMSSVEYFVKVQTANDKFAFLRINQGLFGNVELTKYQVGKTAKDEIEYFE